MNHSHDPLFAPEKRRHPALGFWALLLAVVIAAALAFNHLNNSRVNLLKESVTVPNLPSSMENFRILHISDLHGLLFGARQERLAAAIASAKYNIVCVTGDITGKDGDISAFLSLLELFRGKVPVYFIPGDEDPAPLIAAPPIGNSPKADYILAAEAHGAIYLDAPQKITIGRDTLWLDPEWVYTLDLNASEKAFSDRYAELLAEAASPQRDAALLAVEYELEQLSRVRAARREASESDIHIALTHHPLPLSSLQALHEWTAADNDSYIRSVSLVLSGHYVGGQWRVPGMGGVRAPLSAGLENNGWFPDDARIMGLSSFVGIPQYISPGLGASAAVGLPGFRLFNTPAVTQITLTSKMIH